MGCPIRISTDQSLLAAPRGFSQRATSFIASWCQGIHRMPLSYSDPVVRFQASVFRKNRSHRKQTGNRRRISIISAQNPDFFPLLEESRISSGSIHTRASEPSLSDLGAHARPQNPNRGVAVQTHSPGQTSTGQRDEHETKSRFHRTRPETHQNLIHPDKEQQTKNKIVGL